MLSVGILLHLTQHTSHSTILSNQHCSFSRSTASYNLIAINKVTTLSITQKWAIAKERKKSEQQGKKCFPVLLVVYALKIFPLKRPATKAVMTIIFNDSRPLEDADSIAVHRERGP